ncbi:hypothetical protein VNO77_21897 [Canavalia gladiata]|uniref:Disease resistance protein n=1 Tax=Canavalia gladiata TaxID=3824 RepID=A0AAN9L323_CANGL
MKCLSRTLTHTAGDHHHLPGMWNVLSYSTTCVPLIHNLAESNNEVQPAHIAHEKDGTIGKDCPTNAVGVKRGKPVPGEHNISRKGSLKGGIVRGSGHLTEKEGFSPVREGPLKFDELGKETKVGVKTRHLSFSMLSDPLSENFDVIGRLKFLRTFLPVDLKESPFHNEEAARLILLNLKYVRILSFSEFSGLDALPDSIGTPFPSLKHLIFVDMRCWEMWGPFESNAFPQLELLDIDGCPRLRGQLPTHLPSLGSLKIDGCNELACSLPSAPVIKELRIRNSSKVRLQELPSSLEDLWIEGSHVESMFEAISYSNTQPSSSNFYSFLGDCLPSSLTQLTIFNCNKLHLPDFLPSLPLDTFTNLNQLNIYNCKNIGCVTVSQSLPKLASFSVVKCPNFVSFPMQGLPAPNLFQFIISDCYKLESLPSHMNTLLPKLEYLYIDDCPEIESFPEGGMPPSLRKLHIENCHKLLRSPSLASMDMLSELHIRGPCEEVNSFPKEGLVLLPPSLTFLELYSLQNVETLECKGLLHLTSLQLLTIRECPKLENMLGERLPASLIKLQIDGCPLLQERSDGHTIKL